ncbi:SDR family NAD(P)-dependent oxidoreductase [Actinophytocola algeriensis]|uniref:NAD(P)-dependent dehydrogenase (Short-subunit alcohol dehydrogenase family) n=1 Tax=Actinophytocola algeriensis TaxID=1768010 RepID=A0A7W7Q2M2_9PSEU|nr:SDR family NAD(P)-dependent oxidoreductase [Actinophytocola algeriensis]MBB4905826.1 NAD(P)-dependent dehydrogenase (short-subunit alcohol dehydrogenase family) [Actinophytocola algeriensis]MBE1472489.1 NAD(P)-dependent dehydrogenase (short-subunit alcohol dehydrogenase family) [Actinophytocola algeriensis]
MTTPRVALVTGATQGLGLALVEGLAHRMAPHDTVYLTGRDLTRVTEAVDAVPGGGAQVRGELLDVADPHAAARLARQLRDRHGGVDIVFGNAVMRVGPDDDPRAVIEQYTEVNNFGTTRLLRAFAPLVRDGGRLIVVASSLGTLHQLAPVLHRRFDGLPSLDEVDRQVAAWRDAVKDGSARAGAWPGFVNIPSKIAQVAAVRTLASQRRERDAERGVLVAAACPGMLNTPTSALWWDVSAAASPAEGAVALLDLAFDPARPGQYGELVRHGEVVPWSSLAFSAGPVHAT